MFEKKIFVSLDRCRVVFFHHLQGEFVKVKENYKRLKIIYEKVYTVPQCEDMTAVFSPCAVATEVQTGRAREACNGV